MTTALELINAVQDELGLARSTSISSLADRTATQMLALMNRTGSAISTETDYQFLAAESRFQTVVYQYTGDTTAGSTTITNLSSVAGLTTDFMAVGTGIQTDSFITSVGVNSAVLSIPASVTGTGVTLTFGQAKYPVPADYARLENDTIFNKSNRWAVLGPKSPQEWQWIKSSYVTAGPMMRFRIMGNALTLWPMPSTVLTIGYEYVSKNWALSAGGVGQPSLLLNTDTSLLPDNLLILGCKYRFLDAKELSSSAAFEEFNRELIKFKGQNAGADKLNLAPRAADRLLTTSNSPDSGFGSARL